MSASMARASTSVGLQADRAREGLERSRHVAALVAAEDPELAAHVPGALDVAEVGEALDEAGVLGVELGPLPRALRTETRAWRAFSCAGSSSSAASEERDAARLVAQAPGARHVGGGEADGGPVGRRGGVPGHTHEDLDDAGPLLHDLVGRDERLGDGGVGRGEGVGLLERARRGAGVAEGRLRVRDALELADALGVVVEDREPLAPPLDGPPELAGVARELDERVERGAEVGVGGERLLVVQLGLAQLALRAASPRRRARRGRPARRGRSRGRP